MPASWDSTTSSSRSRLAQLQREAAEGKKYTPQADLLFVLILGSTLVYVGIPVVYIWYASTQAHLYSSRRTPLPLITDMFGDWPIQSAITAGIGTTLLFTGLIATAISRIPFDVQFHPRTKLVRYSILTQSVVWLVICSSSLYPEGDDVQDWIHNIATFVFMVSTVYMLFVAVALCDFFARLFSEEAQLIRADVPPSIFAAASDKIRSIQNDVLAARVSLWIATVGVLGATVDVGVIALNNWSAEPDHKEPQYMWQILVAFEYVVVIFSGTGYFLAVYAYAGIEEVAGMGREVVRTRMMVTASSPCAHRQGAMQNAVSALEQHYVNHYYADASTTPLRARVCCICRRNCHFCNCGCTCCCSIQSIMGAGERHDKKEGDDGSASDDWNRAWIMQRY